MSKDNNEEEGKGAETPLKTFHVTFQDRIVSTTTMVAIVEAVDEGQALAVFDAIGGRQHSKVVTSDTNPRVIVAIDEVEAPH